MKNISLILSLLGCILVVGCKSIPIIPATQLSINYTEISQADAKKMYRKKLIHVLQTSLFEADTSTVLKWFPESDYSGAKSADNGNDVAFIYQKDIPIFSSTDDSMIMTDIDKDAEIELYYTAPSIRGWGKIEYPETYTLLITNAHLCRATVVEDIQYINGYWSFETRNGASAVGCYGGRQGSINGVIFGGSYSNVQSAKNNMSLNDSILIEHLDKNLLEELASIIKAAFSNAN